MEQRLSVLTLGVRDLAKMRDFYVDRLGWKPVAEGPGIVFFLLNGFLLGLFPQEELSREVGSAPQGGPVQKGFTLAQNFGSEAEVDQAFARLERQGVKILKPPQKVFWGGYSGYFADLEDNLWELCFNPYLSLDPQGNVLTHLPIGPANP